MMEIAIVETGFVWTAAGGGSSSLSGLTDVDLTAPTDAQVLKYSTSEGKWINGADTGGEGPAGPEGPQGPQGEQGPTGADGAQGDSAFQVWLDAGNTGTEADFLLSLKGAKGDTGDQGIQGETGATGEQGPAGNDGAPGADGDDGAPGRSIQVFDEIPTGDFGTDFFAGDVVLL